MSVSQYFWVCSCFAWGPEGLTLCLRLTVTVYDLHPSYADRTSICLRTHTCIHTRRNTHCLMSSSQCTLVFCVSRLGYPVLLADGRRQESSFHYNFRLQPGTARESSLDLNFSILKVWLRENSVQVRKKHMILYSSLFFSYDDQGVFPHFLHLFYFSTFVLPLVQRSSFCFLHLCYFQSRYLICASKGVFICIEFNGWVDVNS